MSERVLVVAAHPDDEILGVGGTLARHAAEGASVDVLIMAEGATSRDRVRDPAARTDDLSALRDAARKAAEILGLRPPRFAGLPDNRMDSLELLDVVKLIEKVVSEVRPDVVYTHHAHDLNIDHRITHEAVLTACRPLPGAPVSAIYAYETVSSTEWGVGGNCFEPTHFVEITTQLERKIAALEAYALEMRPAPHARSIETVRALAKVRGSSVGVAAAEAFMVVRQVRR
ncbi:MAG TPA: PIG-L family deacetylase [Xanthobacteraceae bacterium]|jgi:LmbE family N-acetylglucosaminyl deacetylase|nr:PIG-L family deacetylase [Xanthobacteraceae bacterium]